MHPVKSKREAVGFSVKDLAEYTGLATGTISAIENGTSEYKTHVKVAELLADAFGCTVRELFEADEVSHLGRPPLTGRPVTESLTITWTKRAGLRTDTFTFTHERRNEVCDTCHLELPLIGECSTLTCTN